MTPVNDPNGKPLIYRIADALGITHLVVAVQHSHLMSEITGLIDALATKANAVPAGSPSGGIVIAATSGELGRSNKTLNDFMPATTVDSTPTTNSDNLVTSGGVAAAIGVIEINDVNFDASTLAKGIAYTMLFHNDTGDLTTLEELIDIENLPTAEKQIWFNVGSQSVELGTGETAMLRIIRTTQGVFVWYDGTFDY